MQQEIRLAPRRTGFRPAERIQPARFVAHMQQLFQEDPDPLFLEESWAMGVAAAIESYHRRQRVERAEDGYQARAVQELERMARLEILPDAGGASKSFAAERAQPIRLHDRPDDYAAQGPRATTATASARVAAACETLGVARDAGRTSVRSAYRRLVVKWHPDRVQAATVAERQRANERLAELNEAYRVLCGDVLDPAA